MTNYFENCNSVAEIKKLYRQLALKNHPDKGGDLKVMQSINAQYTLILKTFDGTTQEEYTYHYNEQTETAIMEKISEIISKNLDVEISLIGNWIWITGNTKEHRAELKKLGCKWHSKRICWYWNNGAKRYNRNSKVSLEELAEKYGCKNFTSNKKYNITKATA